MSKVSEERMVCRVCKDDPEKLECPDNPAIAAHLEALAHPELKEVSAMLGDQETLDRKVFKAHQGRRAKRESLEVQDRKVWQAVRVSV